MHGDELAAVPVRFLPAALLAPRSLSRLRRDLRLLSWLALSGGNSAGPERLAAASLLEFALAELDRHAGGRGEVCILTKDAVFDLSARLGEAAELLVETELDIPVALARRLEAQLVGELVEAQPVAPA